MNNDKKRKIFESAADTRKLLSCEFKHDRYKEYLHILDVSDKFVLGVSDIDFLFDEFIVKKISHLKSAWHSTSLNDTICKEMGLFEAVQKPEVDITSWKSVLSSLKTTGKMIIIENGRDDGYFCMGFVDKLKSSHAVCSTVDADGVWYEKIKIPYSEITSVKFDGRYSRAWHDYLLKHDMLPKH